MREKSDSLKLFDYQAEFLLWLEKQPENPRACLYYRTGAGKSLTAILGMKQLGHSSVLIVAPPSTHQQWLLLAEEHGIEAQAMSHAKFRMKDTRVHKTRGIIMDEFHMLGGQKGQGWKKLDTLARHLQAPLFILSATPQYNDAERCYCVQHVLDPHSCKGGYIAFLYQHCETEQNPFGQEPNVVGFLRFKDAAEYLSSLPAVHYVQDDLMYTIKDVTYPVLLPYVLTVYGLDTRRHRMVASAIEMRHTIVNRGLIDDVGYLRRVVFKLLRDIIRNADSPVLIFSNHSTVAEALARSFDRSLKECAIITGATPLKQKEQILNEFRAGEHSVLIGTATLATGTDGLDKVCNTLVILDDTDDDSLRRQLIGRIMPRGAFDDTTTKSVIRLTPFFT